MIKMRKNSTKNYQKKLMATKFPLKKSHKPIRLVLKRNVASMISENQYL